MAYFVQCLFFLCVPECSADAYFVHLAYYCTLWNVPLSLVTYFFLFTPCIEGCIMTNTATFSLSYFCPTFLCCILLFAYALTQFSDVNNLIWCFTCFIPYFYHYLYLLFLKCTSVFPQIQRPLNRLCFCLTGGFHQSRLTLTWISQSANIDHLSVTNCPLRGNSLHSSLSEHPADRALLSSDWLVNTMPAHQSECFQVIDNHCQGICLFNYFFSPKNAMPPSLRLN